MQIMHATQKRPDEMQVISSPVVPRTLNSCWRTRRQLSIPHAHIWLPLEAIHNRSSPFAYTMLPRAFHRRFKIARYVEYGQVVQYRV